MEAPSYYAIIPANVRYDKDLTPNSKLLYAEITSLCNKEGFCWATNDYFAQLYGVSKVSISKWISQLVEKNYVNSQLIYKPGTKQILNRYLTLVGYPIKENFNTPIKENFKDNNTSINNKDNTKREEEFFPAGYSISDIDKKNEKAEAKKVAQKKVLDYFHEICVNLPKVKVFSTTRKNTISTRIKEHGIENILEVIEKTSKSNFLNGENKRDWKADFDWILNASNFIKILEDNYLNKTNNGTTNNRTANGGKITASQYFANEFDREASADSKGEDNTIDVEAIIV